MTSSVDTIFFASAPWSLYLSYVQDKRCSTFVPQIALSTTTQLVIEIMVIKKQEIEEVQICQVDRDYVSSVQLNSRFYHPNFKVAATTGKWQHWTSTGSPMSRKQVETKFRRHCNAERYRLQGKNIFINFDCLYSSRSEKSIVDFTQ